MGTIVNRACNLLQMGHLKLGRQFLKVNLPSCRLYIDVWWLYLSEHQTSSSYQTLNIMNLVQSFCDNCKISLCGRFDGIS